MPVGFRVIATLIGLVVLMSLIAVAFALRKLRDEHMNLRAVVVSGLNSTVQAEEGKLAELQSRLGALENQLNGEEFLAAPLAEDPEAWHAGLHSRISGTQPAPEAVPEPAPESVPEPAPEAVPEPDTEPDTESDSQEDFKEYIVQPGDTISEIGRLYKVTVAAIIRASGITNPDRILVGEVLKIPSGE